MTEQERDWIESNQSELHRRLTALKSRLGGKPGAAPEITSPAPVTLTQPTS